MKKILGRFVSLFFILLMLAAPVLARDLVPVGQVVGIEIGNDRLTVAAVDDVLGLSAKKAGLKIGDELREINGCPIKCAEDVQQALLKSDGRVTVTVLRGGQVHVIHMNPEITAQGPKLGVYLRQGVSGIGTVTWYDPETGDFGALGHGVNGKQGSLIEMTHGQVYAASVISVRKGETGAPGQLMGTMRQVLGELTYNTQEGVFGKLARDSFAGEAIPTASWQEITTGSAVIRSTVGRGETRDYSVEILKIYPNGQNGQRNLLLKVTDPALLEKTGGIVQGMSGSPILQNGKLIGAVTHVCVTSMMPKDAESVDRDQFRSPRTCPCGILFSSAPL